MNESGMEDEALQQLDNGESEVEEVTSPVQVAVRKPTGDDAVDKALDQLDAMKDEPLDSQIQVGEQVHRVLQGRLADLGKE